MSNVSPNLVVPSSVILSPLVDPKTGSLTFSGLNWFQRVTKALNDGLLSPTFRGVVTQPTPSVLTQANVATTATAGGASALPATPAGYLIVSINGTNYKMPYYPM